MAKRSARAGGMVSGGLSGGMRITKEVQLFDIDYNNHHEGHRLELWTKHSTVTSSSRSSTSGNKGGNSSKKDLQMTQNNQGTGAAGGKKGVNEITTGASNLTINNETKSKETSKLGRGNITQSQQRRNQRPILEHQSDEQTRSVMTPPPKMDAQAQQQQRPRIYLEDNDPEFDDFDEEDPDDDLDI